VNLPTLQTGSHDLKDRIYEAIQSSKQEALQKQWGKFVYRLQVVRITNFK
jgi:hypothetical protein